MEESNDNEKKPENRGGWSNNIRLVSYIGVLFKQKYDTFKVTHELEYSYSKNGKHKYRNFKTECLKCEAVAEMTLNRLNSGAISCKVCKENEKELGLKSRRERTIAKRTERFSAEDKIKIKQDIDAKWKHMMDLERQNELTKYLEDKYNIHLPGPYDDYNASKVEDDEYDGEYDGEYDWDEIINLRLNKDNDNDYE